MIQLDDILSSVDLEKVQQAICVYEQDEKPMADFDIEDARKLVWTAAEKWLVRDLTEFTLDRVEKEQIINDFKFVMDLSGMILGNNKPFQDFGNKRYIIDWKTSKNSLTTEWKDRLINSWQWRLYSDVVDASLFVYRGLSRNGDTKEVLIQVPEENGQEALEQRISIGREIHALRDIGAAVWPRNMPFACGAYGRDCEFMKDCQDYSMPKGVPPEKLLSYSYMSTFQLCNEKARRYAMGHNNDNSDETNFGRAVHRGLAELWRQAYGYIV